MEGKNSLSIKYKQSHLYQNVIEELDYVNPNISEEVKGEDKAADYATSFQYQVSESGAENFEFNSNYS